jgi:hypothetical protein
MSQDNAADYGFILPMGQAGQKADIGFDRVDSFAAEGVVHFGAPVTRGTDPAKQCRQVAGANDTFLGIGLFTQAMEQKLLVGLAQYDDKDTVNVLRKGRCLVRVSEDVVAGDAAYVDLGDTLLTFCKTAASNVATGGHFETSALSGELAWIEI